MPDFKLYPPQREALLTEANEILYGGAVGGGKSYLARVASILYSLEIPGLITYLFRRTYKEVLANHIYTPGGYLEMLHDLIKSGDVFYSKTDNSISFYNGSRIQLAHCQYESDVYQYQGAQIGFLIIDESTHFSASMVKFLRTRVRLGSLAVPAKWQAQFPRILYTSNPGGIGHHYFKSGFVDVANGLVIKAPKDDGSMLRTYIPAKLTDNKVLMQTDPDYADRVRGLGDERMSEALIDGDWEILSTGGFSDLWRSAVHVIPEFTIPHTWRIDRGYDYGSSAPAAAIWFAESNGESFLDANGREMWVPPKSLFAIKECYLADADHKGLRLTAQAQGKMIYNCEQEAYWRHRVHPGPADNAIFAEDRPGVPCIADEMLKENISFTRSDKSPGSRVQGTALMRSRLDASLRKDPEHPHIYVFNTCYNTIRTIPNLENDSKNIEDIDTKGEDHIWDVFRYKLLSSAMEITTGRLGGH